MGMPHKLESELKLKCRRYAEALYDGKLISSSPKGVIGYPDADLLLPECPIVKLEFKRSVKEHLSAAQKRWADWFESNNICYARVSTFDEFVQLCGDHWKRHVFAPSAALRDRVVEHED